MPVLLEQPRHPSIGEHLAPGLAVGAVRDLVGLVRHPAQGLGAAGTGGPGAGMDLEVSTELGLREPAGAPAKPNRTTPPLPRVCLGGSSRSTRPAWERGTSSRSCPSN